MLLRILTPVMCAVLLSACSQPWVRETIDGLPTAYTGHNTRGKVLKPGADWQDVGDLAAYTGEQEEAVTVFPVDDAPAPMPAYSAYESMPVTDGASSYGYLAQQVFFRHGSSALTVQEKSTLGSLARDIDPGTAVTVVGHASKRVDGVSDPVQRKMINLEMAQKRADAVTRELEKAGMKPGWVQSLSRGDEEPNPAPGSLSQEAADRRAEVYVGAGE